MKTSLVPREKYIDEALAFRDTDLVKVVTGIRRCGKSSLLRLVRERIESEGVASRAFVDVNLEMRGLGIATADQLYAHLASRMAAQGRTYVFLDEVQRVAGWHDVVNSLRVEFDCDIYITGSNAWLLSSELATHLSGRYVEVRMLPLSLSEYLGFCGIEFPEGSSVATTPAGDAVSFDDVMRRYLEMGGMPALAASQPDQRAHAQYLEGVYNTVVVRDILNRERNRDQRAVTDPDLLGSICEYLADTVAREASAKKIAGALTSAGRKTSHTTVAAYMRALEEAYVVYPCRRFDIHGKAVLKTLPKYYIVDLGLRRFLTGYVDGDMGPVFENAVYLQLLYDGWSVRVGKLYQSEVDFVATKDGRTVYLQVTDEMFATETRERELAPLRAIRDAHEKMVVVRQGDATENVDGIRVVRARDFFLRDARTA